MAKLFNGEGYEIKVNKSLYSGPNSVVESVTLTKGNHKLDLLKKKVRGYSADFMDGPKWHTLLKSRGYPVVPTYRYDPENSIEYVTDLRRSGTHRVIDFCGDKDNYKEVFVSNIVEVEKEVGALLEKSANDGLVINEPNIFFDVEISTGIAKVLIGETRELGYDSGNEDKVPSREEIFKHNSWILKEHVGRLKSIMVKK